MSKIKTPIVTVIVPNYNYAHLIIETLASVKAQTYPHFECIIVDDGSTDNSVEVINDFIKDDNRFSLLQKTNGGLPSTRNEGMKLAKGDFLAFLDADDLWAVDKLKNQLEIIDKSNCDVVFSKIQNFSSNGNQDVIGFNQKDLTVYDFLANNPIPGGSSNFMMKKSVFEAVGFYNNDLRSSEDLHYFFRIALNGFKYAYSDTLDVKIRKHDGSMSYNYLKMYLGKLYCFELSLDMISKTDFLNKKELDKAFFIKFVSMLWTARNTKKNELIKFTYNRFRNLIGFKFYFSSVVIKCKYYDLKIKLINFKNKLKN